MASNRKQVLLISDTMIGVKYSTLRGKKKQEKRMGWLKKVGLPKFIEQAGAIFLKLLKTKNDIKTDLDNTTVYSNRGWESGDWGMFGGGMWGNGSIHRSGGWGGSSTVTYPKKEKFHIIDLQDPDKMKWVYDDKDFIAAAIEAGLKVEKVKDEDDDKVEITTIYIDGGAYRLEYPYNRSVQTCGFQGTKEYLQHMFGRTLHKADEDWYKACPYNESSGVPTHYASTVINDLVRPYGLGVAKVFVRKGLSTHTDAPLWMKALGINPMAVGDHTIDNHTFIQRVVEMKAAAAEKAGKPLTDEERQKIYDEMLDYANKNYRFEYVTDAPRGSILLYAMSSKGTGNAAPTFASGHGHTKFYAPRERQTENSWKIALQLDLLENIKYKAEPPLCPDPEPTKILEPWNCEVNGYRMKAYEKNSFSWSKRISDENEKREKAEEAAKNKTKKEDKKEDKKHSSTESSVKVEEKEKSKK